MESYCGAVASNRLRLFLVDFDCSGLHSIGLMGAFLLLAIWHRCRPKAQFETWPLHFVPPRAHGRRTIKRISDEAASAGKLSPRCRSTPGRWVRRELPSTVNEERRGPLQCHYPSSHGLKQFLTPQG